MGKFQKILKLFGLPPWYHLVPKKILIVNYLFQRIFRLNAEVPFSVNHTSRIQGYSNMILSDQAKFSFTISGGIYVTAFQDTKLTIGDNTIIAPNVAIQTGNHDLNDRNIYTIGNISIGKNCWLGFGCVILPGVSLGNNVTVGANAVVTKSFPDNVVIAGVPAKIIKKF
jgi:acetyltransferase-like isoleucine patch superfamily enzyme